MSHELDRNDATGGRSMFYVGETPWHKEGIGLESAPRMPEALRLAGLDWEVQARPIYVLGGGTTLRAPGQAIVRMDRFEGPNPQDGVLSVVGPDYVPLQQWDAFAPLEPLLDRGVCTLETAGSLRGGRDVWMLAKFNLEDAVVSEVFRTEVQPYALIRNNHAGEARATIMETPIRVVCANTLGAAMRGSRSERAIHVSHRGDAKLRLVEAAEKLFAGLTERYRLIAADYAALKSRILTVQEFEQAVTDTMVPMPESDSFDMTSQDGRKAFSRAMDKATVRRDTVRALWTGGKGHAADFSAWEAYNAAVECLDHDAETFRTRGSRVQALLGGRLGELKTAVLDNLLAVARG